MLDFMIYVLVSFTVLIVNLKLVKYLEDGKYLRGGMVVLTIITSLITLVNVVACGILIIFSISKYFYERRPYPKFEEFIDFINRKIK